MSSVELLSATITSTRPWVAQAGDVFERVDDGRGSRSTPPPRSTPAASSPTPHSPTGGSSGSGSERVIARVKIMNQITSPGMYARKIGITHAITGPIAAWGSAAPRLRHPDAEPDPRQRQGRRNHESDGRPEPGSRSSPPHKDTLSRTRRQRLLHVGNIHDHPSSSNSHAIPSRSWNRSLALSSGLGTPSTAATAAGTHP